ncbi:MAG: hypothetical protein K1X63_12375 [Chitinophagales bacterium]|nr:hypothetical protein [Chitinophagales bacterium]
MKMTEVSRTDLLSKLAPAQTLYIIKPVVVLRELLKFTFMDLVLREWLQLTRYDPHPVQGESRLGDALVVPGKNFKQEKPMLHEMVFLYPFYKKPGARVVMKHLLQMALSAASSEGHFKEKLMMKSREMNPLFKKTFIQKIFGGQNLTEEGKFAQEDLIRQLNVLDKELPALLKSDKDKASALLKKIRGNVCLLNSFKFEMIERIGQELLLLEEELEGGAS